MAGERARKGPKAIGAVRPGAALVLASCVKPQVKGAR